MVDYSYDFGTWKVNCEAGDVDRSAWTAGEVKTVHTAGSGFRWVLLAFSITVSGATTITVQDDQATPEVYEELDFSARGHTYIVYPPPGKWAATAASKLNFKSSDAVNVGVHTIVVMERV